MCIIWYWRKKVIFWCTYYFILESHIVSTWCTLYIYIYVKRTDNWQILELVICIVFVCKCLVPILETVVWNFILQLIWIIIWELLFNKLTNLNRRVYGDFFLENLIVCMFWVFFCEDLLQHTYFKTLGNGTIRCFCATNKSRLLYQSLCPTMFKKNVPLLIGLHKYIHIL